MSRFVHLGLCPLFYATLFSACLCFAADGVKDEAKKDGSKDEPKVIKPADVKDYLNKKATVEFTVAASKELPSGVCFLNSEKDLKSPDNFTAFITGKGLTKFKEDAKIEQPAEHFHGKKIRVTGVVKKYREKLEIEVVSPDQIKIIEEEKKGETKDEKKGEKPAEKK